MFRRRIVALSVSLALGIVVADIFINKGSPVKAFSVTALFLFFYLSYSLHKNSDRTGNHKKIYKKGYYSLRTYVLRWLHELCNS